MTTANVNGHQLYYELSGEGVPVVLVHGSWASHEDWRPVVPGLAEQMTVLAYDRRGHSLSERPARPDSVHEDVADLAALIEHLDLAPAWVAGNSFGAAIALRVAGERPDLLRGVIAHEPPLFGAVRDDAEIAPMIEELNRRVGKVAERIAAGDDTGAAEEFIETVALGPGSWRELPPEMRERLVFNAPTFLDEARDPDALSIDLDRLAAFDKPMLLTKGGQSPPAFAPVVEKLGATCPHAEVRTFPESGHIPHATHPDAYVETAAAFIRSAGRSGRA